MKLDESKRQIRLLELHPGSGEEPISGNLITMDLPVLPGDFDEGTFLDELTEIATREIVPAVRSGHWVLQGYVDRWEFIQESLIWLLRNRLHASYHVLRYACGAHNMGRLKDMRLSYSATWMQEILTSLATALLLNNTNHSWNHDLNGLIARLCAQGKRARDYISHFAKQIDTAIDKFISEDSEGDGDGISALTPVDIPGLERFPAEADSGCWPPFTTISWFWGDAEQRDQMELDGQFLDVPLNATRALRDLRDSVRSRSLWIDAVCINQDDKPERASQILFMSYIYSFADLTYVWLGNDNFVIREAIGAFKDILRYLQRAADFGIRIIADGDVSPSGTSYLSADKAHKPDWTGSANAKKSLEELLREWPAGHQMTETEWRSEFISRLRPCAFPIFELPWFSRLWVFQEAALSRRCTIVFGPNTTLS